MYSVDNMAVYATYNSPAKFQAILGIIGSRLKMYPKAICSYSGGSDSDIMIDLIERARRLFGLAPIKYVFFNTGLEMHATKEHVKETEEKYGVEIEECRPKIGIVQAVRKCGVPFYSKKYSQVLESWQYHGCIPIRDVKEYYDTADDKRKAYEELKLKYPHQVAVLNSILCCDKSGDSVKPGMNHLSKAKYLLDYIIDYPPDFRVSAKCCDYCKKQVAKDAQSGYEMSITGERHAEGGVRQLGHIKLEDDETECFFRQKRDDIFRLRPLYYVTNMDKQWYKNYYGIKYSDAYKVYGMKRTGCCGCPISFRAVDDLEIIRPYEPNVVKAAWNIFGKSYMYRQKYNEYKANRRVMEMKGDNKNEVVK